MRFLITLLLIFATVPAVAQTESGSITEDTWQFLTELKWSSGPQALADIKDPNARIAMGYRRILTGDITPQQFYAEMKTLDLGGRQLRDKMVEVKSLLLNSPLGTEAAQHFLGEVYVLDQSELDAGSGAGSLGREPGKPLMGSQVEDRILGWRDEFYDQVKRRTMERLAAEFAGDSRKFSAFLADVGSRPEGPGKKAFEGDLDVNFVSAHPEMGRRFLAIFDEEVSAGTGGLTGVDIDMVATVFGMSGPEVYAGEAGRIKAIEMYLENKVNNVQRVDLHTGRIGEQVTGRQAMRVLALEGGLEGIQIPETGNVKLPPAGPALIFEMARHLDRDVLRSLQFEDMTTFLKIAKFVERASGEAERAGHPIDADLVDFSKNLVEAKAQGDYVRASEVIRSYFKDDMPLDVDLGRSRDGKSQLTLEANRKFVSEFGESCFAQIMTAGRDFFADEVKAIEGRVRLLKAGMESPQDVAGDMAALRNDMEVERLILEDPTEGLRTMDTKVAKMVDDLGELSRSFMQDNWQTVLPEHLKRQRRFVEEILVRDGEVNHQLAAATIAYTPADALSRGLEVVDGINSLLDSIDETLLGPMRGEVDWGAAIFDGHQVSYSTRAGEFLDIESFSSTSVASYLSDLEGYTIGVEVRLNSLFFDNCLAHRIQEANRDFADFVSQHETLGAGLKALEVIQLADELPAYWEAFDKASLEEGFGALAVAILENRMPGASSLQHMEKGNVALACLDFVALFYPPTAMLPAAWGLGKAIGDKSWNYWWSSELDLFTDTLYENATWESAGVQRVGDGIDLERMKLKSVTYRDHVIVLDEYLAEKKKQIGEMQAAMRVPYKDRRFPYEHVAFDPFLGWLGAGDMLRENLARVDNVLLVLDEEKKKKKTFVGENSKYADQVHQEWTLRWEQVKVAFLERLIDQLEGRAENQGHGIQRLAEVLLELYEVTEELKVTDQVFASLGKDAGSTEAASWMSWFYDFLVTGKRAAFDQAAPESQFTEANRIAIDYLEVYSTVLETRAAAETLYVGDGRPAEDAGLRILSTPFLLSCKADRDKTGYVRSASMPVAKLREIDLELTSIKRAFVPGGRLDGGAESFDQKILQAMTYHDVFKELWKTVEVANQVTQGDVTNLDYRLWFEYDRQMRLGDHEEWHAAADEGLAAVMGPDQIDGIGSAEIPLARFRHHDAERDRLALEFLEHYLTGGDRLAGLVTRAEELAAQIEGACALAETEIEAVSTGAETLSAQAADLVQSMAAVETRLEELGALLDEISRHHADAETAATAVAEAAAEAERLSLEICNRLKRVKATADPDLRRQLMTEAWTLNEYLDGEVEVGDDSLAGVEESAEGARVALNEIESVIDEVRMIDEAAQSAADGSEFEDRLAAASDALGEIPALIDDLGEVREEAVDILGAVITALERFTESEDTIELAGRVEAAVERVVFLTEEAEGNDETEACWVTVSDLLEETGTELDGALAELGDANRRLASAVSTADAHQERVDEARRSTESAEYLVELAADYRERLQTAADGARLCLDLAKDLFMQGTVPDVVGRPLAEAQRILANAGLQPRTQGGSPAPSTELAYGVEAQLPEPGEQVPEDGMVTLIVYGPSGTIRVPAVHGLAAAGARSAIEGAGLVAAFVAGGPAASPDEAFMVETQNPAAGAIARRGETVTVRITGAFDVAAATQGVDCSAWPGTVAVWDSGSGRAECDCPSPGTWSAAEGRCVAGGAVAAAGAQQMGDPCAERDSVFWQLMTAQRLDDARDVLLQSQDCGFYSRGVQALQDELNAICQRISMQILQACSQGNLAQAQALIQEAARNRCRVSPEAYQCIERAQRSQRQQKKQRQWAQVFGMVNQIAQQVQQERNTGSRGSGSSTTFYEPTPTTSRGPSLSDIDIGGVWQDPPAGGGTSGGGTSGQPPGGGGGGGGGRSEQDCEGQYCSMCSDDIDLLGVSRDPQCNKCRSLNAANIKACMEGGRAGPAVVTQSTYRLVCERSDFDSPEPPERCGWYSCLEPSDVKGPHDIVISIHRSWDHCYEQSSLYTGEGMPEQ